MAEQNDTADTEATEAAAAAASDVAESAAASDVAANATDTIIGDNDAKEVSKHGVTTSNDGGANAAKAAAADEEATTKNEEPKETSSGDGESSQTDNDKKRPIEETAKTADDEGPLPTLPLKRARTGYFIFADEKRDEVKKKHQGEGVAAIAKAIGQLWSALTPSEKEVYETQSAKERERVSHDMQRLKDAGMWPESGSADADGGGADDDAVIFPIGRIRKICKLDPDVKGMSKESALLITKATELFCTKLGKECVTMAQMQNRRKLLPDDVVEVCSIKEAFMFLRADIIDLRKAQIEEMNLKEKENGKDGKKVGAAGKAGEDGGTNTLDSYFGKVRN